MTSRFTELERRTIIVQFIAVDPLAFYATADGTDLVQDNLRSHLARADADILGQAGSLSIGDNGEFLTFEPTDTKNRTLHLPVEHLAYCGALRRMRRDPSDQRNPDQILQRDFENVDLANRYPQHIIGPPIFVAVFHGFDNALCYTFVTQNSDDACLLVMKLMRAFRYSEQQQHHQLEQQQGQITQGLPSQTPVICEESPSRVIVKQEAPLHRSSQTLFTTPSTCLPMTNPVTTVCIQDPCQDELVQQLLCNPNLQIISPPCSSARPMITQCVTNPSSRTTQPFPSVNPIMLSYGNPTVQQIGGATPLLMRPYSPPIITGSEFGCVQNLPLGSTLPPQVIYKPNNQEITYKQNVYIRWLKPPTPPPQSVIIREIQCPPEIPPPIIYRQMPPCPPSPPPIVIREPPPCLPSRNSIVVEKQLPRTCLPPQVLVQQCPAPPPKPQKIIYERYLPPPPDQQCQVNCQPVVCSMPQKQVPCRRLVREVVRRIPQQRIVAQPPPPPRQIIPRPAQIQQQYVPVYATRRHIVQPKGIRVIRQVIGPAQPPPPLPSNGLQQQFTQIPSSVGALPPGFIQ